MRLRGGRRDQRVDARQRAFENAERDRHGGRLSGRQQRTIVLPRVTVSGERAAEREVVGWWSGGSRCS